MEKKYYYCYFLCYHQLLILLLYPCRFLQATLHAEPPVSQRDGYIFHKKPKNQHLINQTQLNRWYCNLFDEGLKRNVVKTYMRYPLYSLQNLDCSLDDIAVSFIIEAEFLALDYMKQ